MVEYLPWKLSPFFRQSIEAVPKILSRKFGLPSQGRPKIESTIYYSREAVRRAIEEHGDAANVLPFFGVKMTNIMINPDSSVNPKRLKDDGILLKNDGEMCTFFFWSSRARRNGHHLLHKRQQRNAGYYSADHDIGF